MADVTYRTGFGTGNYGVRAYGVDGTITEGISTVVTASATAAAYIRIRGVSSIVVTVSSTASEATRVRESSATASPSTTSTCGAQRVRESASTVSPSATPVFAGLRVRESASAISGAATVTPAFERVRESSLTVLPVLSGTVSAQISIVGAAAADISATTAAICERIKLGNVSIPALVSFTANGIEKWEPLPETAEVWTDVAPATEIWQTAPSATEVWSAIPP